MAIMELQVSTDSHYISTRCSGRVLSGSKYEQILINHFRIFPHYEWHYEVLTFWFLPIFADVMQSGAEDPLKRKHIIHIMLVILKW